MLLEEMVYRNYDEKVCEIIGQGNFEGYDWLIVSYGTHPCAYVIIEPGHELYGVHYLHNYDVYDELNVHGGVTYTEEGLHNFVDSNLWVIGWDYNHLNDYNVAISPEGHKYTSDEIFKDVINCIARLKFLYD